MLRWNSQYLPCRFYRFPAFCPAVTVPAPKIEFYSARDGRRLAVRVWDAAASPRARIVFLHGITSHGGWYSQSGAHLASAGFDVHFLERRGSGLNAGESGDVDRWSTWIDDVTVYLELLRNLPTPDTRSKIRRGEHLTPPPIVLCGISWGGKLAAAVARRHPGLVKALGLICPGLYSPHEPGLLKRIALGAPLPARLRRRRVAIPLRSPVLFTDSYEWRKFIAHDPLSLRQVTWQFAREDRQLTRYARQSAPFLHLPILLVLAGRDRIVDNQRTRAFLSRTGATCRTLVEYPNAAHTLEFEPDPQPYFADLVSWLDKSAVAEFARIPAAPKTI
jgi:acylglycerol lipase